MARTGRVKVAAVQMTSFLDDEPNNLRRVLEKIEEAAAAGARLIVFSEAMSNGYTFRDADHAHRLACPVPGPFTEAVGARAEAHGVYVGIGVLERGPYPEVYNVALLFGPDGRMLGRYRKNFPIRFDKWWFRLRDLTYPVIETPIGKIGFFICADARIPEPARCAALNGAEILLNISNWGGPDQYLMHVPTRAIENRCWVIGADKVGEEPGLKYPGTSTVWDPYGRVVAQASATEEEVIYAEIEPGLASDKRIGDGNDLFADRRPTAYRLLREPFEHTPLSRIMSEPVVPDAATAYVSAVQIARHAPPEAALSDAVARIREAHLLDLTNVVVLPEQFLFTPQQLVRNVREAAEFSARARETLVALARELSIYVGAHLVERDGDRYYSALDLLGPDGVAGRYRRVHLWAEERQWATPGESFEVVRTRFGNVGLMLGYDGLFPESARVLALKGSDLILWPTSWLDEAHYRAVAPERAVENQVYIAAANRADSAAPGPSLVIQPTQYPELVTQVELPSGKAGYVGRLLVLATARVKRVAENTDVFRDRHPDRYTPLA